MSSLITVKCAECGKEKKIFPSQKKGQKYGSFCNKDCLGLFRSKTLTGELGANFKTGIRADRSYSMVLAPWHPKSKKGYVYIHRLIAEARLGRFLKPDEVVHHKDHNTKNNHWNNLEVMTQVEHAREHILTRKRDGRGRI